MEKNILIVEDKKIHIDALNKIISDLDHKARIYCAINEQEAYTAAMKHQIHLFIIDIILDTSRPGDVAGLRFVQEMREVKKYAFTPVIFITSLEDPKLYSYSQLHCFEYIEKPFSIKQVRECIRKALEFPVILDRERFVYFRKDGIVYSKHLGDIIYIENKRRKILIHCRNDELEIPYKTCEQILSELDSPLFVRCSRFTIINRDYIEHIDYANRYIKLENIESLVEIGVMYRNRFKNVMQHGTDNN